MKKLPSKYRKLIITVMLPVNIFLWNELWKEAKLQYEVFKDSQSGARVYSMPRSSEEEIIQVLIKEFIADAANEGIDVDIDRLTFSIGEDLGSESLGEMDELQTLASCARLQGHLTFLRSTVNPYNLYDLRATVYHELGHCIFGLNHDEREQNFPVIMNAEHSASWAAIFSSGDTEAWNQSKKHLFEEIKKSQRFKMFSLLKF